MNYKDTSEENLNNHIDRLKDITESIEIGKVTILTGGNATGKSVIRKILNASLAEKLGKKSVTSSISMQLRTCGNEGLLGTGLDHMHSDMAWESTGEHSLDLLCGLLKSNASEKMADENKRYLVLDEVETGMSREVLLGVCNMLNSEMDNILKNTYGVLLITHSNDVVRNVKHDVFINIEGMTKDEWLNREIVAVTPDEIQNWSLALYKAIRKRQKSN